VCLQVAEAAGIQEELVSKAKQSRSEKKARKAMSKLGKFLRMRCTKSVICIKVGNVACDNAKTTKLVVMKFFPRHIDKC